MSSPEAEALVQLLANDNQFDQDQTSNSRTHERARRTTAASSGRKRQRSQNNDTSKRRRMKKGTKAQKHSLPKRRKVDGTYRHDPESIAYPNQQDFIGTGALDWRNFERVDPATLEEDDTSESNAQKAAPPPFILNPLDDRPYLIEVDVDSPEKKSTKSAKPPRSKAKPRAKEPKAKTSWPQEDPQEEPEREPEKANLGNIPAECREQIFRHLLVTDKPIPVFGGWKKVYKRKETRGNQGPVADSEIKQIYPMVLRLSKRFYTEALCVLYGENTFLYRLRDATNEVANVEELIQDEEPREEGDGSDDSDAGSDYVGEQNEDVYNGDDENDDSDAGSEYGVEQTAVGRPTRQRRGRKAQAEEMNINIDKFKPLIRNIVVEAEHNRFSPGQMKNMAKALEVFVPPKTTPGQRRPRPNQQPNIHTLTIRVWPQLINESTFSFIDFFDPESPIIEAIKTMECQQLSIEIKRKYIMPPGSPYLDKRYRLDMRHHRMNCRSRVGLPDAWRRDRALLEYRQRSVDTTMAIVNNLQKIVRARCEEDGPRLHYDVEIGELFYVWEDVYDGDAEVEQ